ncbi:DUF4097 domain-containing protein [Shouchella tritolerans]|uniref:DUF4097 domain-containing protein n=1 Tax=Shouchella tritolerans TaxID=2979466 RepID=UPI0021E7B2A1|nr:DUF4097 domain-containing protein [Shouchella tritolerans]
MKRIVVILVAVAAIGGLVYGFTKIKENPFRIDESFDSAGIEEIEINNESWDVELKQAESKQLTITAEGTQKNKKYPVTIEKQGNKMTIQQSDETGGSRGFSFGKNGTISVSIPDNEVNTITVSNNNGDIEMKNIATTNLIVTNGSGSERVAGISAEKGQFTSIDGELNVENSSLQEVIVASEAGDSYITNVTSTKMNITSTDGEVAVKEATEEEALFVETKSGDITVSYKEAPASLQLTAQSESADITVGLANMKETKSTDKLKEGTIGDASHTVELLSTHGTINIK